VTRLTKTETSLVIWLNIATIVARSVHLLSAHVREDVHATHQCIVNDAVWSMPCQTCRKTLFQFTTLV